MKKIKDQKAITLIALIITIVVLLIIGGVAINAVNSGDLFAHANNAATAYQTAAQRESDLIESMLSQIPGEGGTGSNSGGNSGSSENSQDELSRYLFGTDGEGRIVAKMSNSGTENILLNVETMAFLQDPEDSSSRVHENLKMAYLDNDGMTIYIRYGRDIYSFSVNTYIDDNGTPSDSSDDLYVMETLKNTLSGPTIPTGNLGKYVRYQNQDWIVLYDDAQKVELILANTIGSIGLGGTTFSDARTSYNNVIDTLVMTAGGTGANGIRNVGGPAVDITTTTVDFSELTTFTESIADSNFAQYEGSEYGLKVGDNNYLADYNQMKSLGIVISDTPADYWLSSRLLEEESTNVNFKVYYISTEGGIDDSYLCTIDDKAASSHNDTSARAVRPVITLSAGALNSITGTGTKTDPLVLN